MVHWQRWLLKYFGVEPSGLLLMVAPLVEMDAGTEQPRKVTDAVNPELVMLGLEEKTTVRVLSDDVSGAGTTLPLKVPRLVEVRVGPLSTRT